VYAFKNGVTQLNEDSLNSLIGIEDWVDIYEGAEVDSKAGAGVTENNLSEYNFAIRITAAGVTEISRVELEVASDGAGKDLRVELRDSNFNPDGSNAGTLLKSIMIPKEFLPANAAYWSIPLDATGLTQNNDYWVIVLKSGDGTDHNHLIGEASQDASHPCYRRSGTSGAWTANNAIHFVVYSGESGKLLHTLFDEASITTTYSGEMPDKTYLHVPSTDGVSGIRQIEQINMSGEYPKRGVVT